LHTFMNLLVKAATSPLSLLAAAFGSSQPLNYIGFPPGESILTPAANAKLATLSKALQNRPGLNVEISGRVDPAVDVNGLREAWLMKSIRKLKREDLGSAAPGGKGASVQISPAEYNAYLTRVYKNADFKKPRDFLGLAKSLPPPQMKKLILENTKVADLDLRKLAGDRANAVRAALSKTVNPARLFITAPKLTAQGIAGKGATTRADIGLK
ncbi:MAG: DUF748 domain-containing protein, partial [Candidatus Binataceae bacterium]